VPKPVGARIIIAVVALMGVLTAIAGGVGSAWAIATPDTLPVFEIGLPVLTAVLVAALVRLAVLLWRDAQDGEWINPLPALASAPKQRPDSAMRASFPQAAFYQEVALPPDAGMPQSLFTLRRHRTATRITMHDDSVRYLVRWRGRPK
jgi:hypothetical protein